MSVLLVERWDLKQERKKLTDAILKSFYHFVYFFCATLSGFFRDIGSSGVRIISSLRDSDLLVYPLGYNNFIPSGFYIARFLVYL